MLEAVSYLSSLTSTRVPSKLNGKLVTNASLGDHDVRLMMESIAIVAARAGNIKVLNQLSENVHLKNIRRLLNRDPRLRKRAPDLIKQIEAAWLEAQIERR